MKFYDPLEMLLLRISIHSIMANLSLLAQDKWYVPCELIQICKRDGLNVTGNGINDSLL